ncbi:PIG-L family deacetylase [Kitasatospora aburaviensis]
MRRRRSAVALLTTLAAALPVWSTQPAAAESTSVNASVVQIVAHQDDDLLFMNPDLLNSIRSGTKTTTIYVTAGESNRKPAEPYARNRQVGVQLAYAAMAGVPCATLGPEPGSPRAAGPVLRSSRTATRSRCSSSPAPHSPSSS